MIVQIYTMQSIEEAVAVARLGVDHLGVTPSNHDLPGEIDNATAREIVEAVRGLATAVALTVDTDFEVIASMCRTVRPDVLHLCGPIDGIAASEIPELRAMIPSGTRIIQAIPMDREDALDLALRYGRVADLLLLDSQAPDIDGIGAAGVVHDWNKSRQIVTRVEVPVILAGGLAPDNVAEAIRVVRPWGVDSLTHTNLPTGPKSFRKDLDKVAAFVENAR